jgi:hypothetical protein
VLRLPIIISMAAPPLLALSLSGCGPAPLDLGYGTRIVEPTRVAGPPAPAPLPPMPVYTARHAHHNQLSYVAPRYLPPSDERAGSGYGVSRWNAPGPQRPSPDSYESPGDYDRIGGAAVSRRLAYFGPLTALHATLPVPSLVEITNLDNNCSLIVRIVGRGSARQDLIVEMSERVGRHLRSSENGRIEVRVRFVEFVAPGGLNGLGGDARETANLRNFPDLGCHEPRRRRTSAR